MNCAASDFPETDMGSDHTFFDDRSTIVPAVGFRYPGDESGESDEASAPSLLEILRQSSEFILAGRGEGCRIRAAIVRHIYGGDGFTIWQQVADSLRISKQALQHHLSEFYRAFPNARRIRSEGSRELMRAAHRQRLRQRKAPVCDAGATEKPNCERGTL